MLTRPARGRTGTDLTYAWRESGEQVTDSLEILRTASSFERALPLVPKHEGGWSDDPQDPGGATNLGVTVGTPSLWLGRPATRAEVKALTVAIVAPLYRRRFWDAIQGDALPAGRDHALFDVAVNGGPKRAAIGLQAGARHRRRRQARAPGASGSPLSPRPRPRC
ncbi:glycosyl hydrolase 108 family protein [Methylobacterium terrae]|uniref:glycosyl hydrolase 108 family protein n=1 Tax=Methylobacterium terrae TaxID=2202827 RepID=UPI003CC95E33